ncbi:MAG: hypothetical protein CMI90_07120 [Pelagibacteraceae bacterium]|nr:hypothetical protein [Pelagibacteraceae bacterium]|tara:strand:- start:400 stop:1710 length:1311 start_codon:yes stop_codon:yes gene_type:complete
MLKIKYITHACLYIEIDNTKILVDPWLKGPSWGGNIWHFPKNNFQIKDFKIPDIIFFSHGHDDHFHYPTIKEIPENWKKKCKIISADYGPENKWWLYELKKAKFKNINLLKHKEKYFYNKKFEIKLYHNDQNETDCSLALKYKGKTIFLQTDNIMSVHQAKEIALENKINVSFMMPHMTGSFPAFYRLKPHNPETMIEGAKNKNLNSLKYTLKISKILKPKYIVPYASDIAYMGENFYANLFNISDKNIFKNFIQNNKIKSKVKIMSPGDQITLDSGKFKFKLSKYKFSFDDLKKFYYQNIEEYDKVLEEEKKYTKPNIVKLRNIFIKSLLKYYNLNNPKIKFNFIFKIKENKNQIINFKITEKKINYKILNKISDKNDLILEIESFRIRRMLHGDYPMQFLTFHNGGYHCTRNNTYLTKKEKKFWQWINYFSIEN